MILCLIYYLNCSGAANSDLVNELNGINITYKPLKTDTLYKNKHLFFLRTLNKSHYLTSDIPDISILTKPAAGNTPAISTVDPKCPYWIKFHVMAASYTFKCSA